MALTYPLTLPKAPRQVELTLAKAIAKTRSPFTFQTQVLVHQGDIWLAHFDFPPMARADADALIAVLWSPGDLQFYLGPTGQRRTPKGIATGTPQIDGASQTGYTLATKGWTVGQTGILQAGDWFQAEGFLYCVAKDADSDGSGLATVELVNRIRTSTTDSAAITVASPVGIFRLANTDPKISIDEVQHGRISLDAEEVL